MSRFLNKKEEVIDLKLTSYGKHMLGRGNFKPTYYAFFDDNVVYDSQYFGRVEVQNEARKRIKDETQYLEGLILFEDLEKNINREGIGEINFFAVDIEPTQESPRKDMFRFDQVLGDAFLQGGTQVAPAWKAVSLENRILSSSFMDAQNNSRVPQIHLTASYSLQTVKADIYYEESFNSLEPRKYELATNQFVDDEIIFLHRQDPLFYFEEMNTELLVKNFDIEVFEFIDTTSGEEFEHLKRKYFERTKPQIVNGFMQEQNNPAEDTEFLYAEASEKLSPQTVKYYFDLVIDGDIPKKQACKAAEEFNKDSYYIDLDFDCSTMEDEDDLMFDIYGSATEAEICLD